MNSSQEQTPQVFGRTVDEQTRCVHYSKPTDVIALKFKCCGDFYPCYQCHDESTDHPIEGWTDDETHVLAVLCGVCRTLLSIEDYLALSGQGVCSVAAVVDDDAMASVKTSSPASTTAAGDFATDTPFACPNCRAPFNPGCKRHYGIYFNLTPQPH